MAEQRRVLLMQYTALKCRQNVLRMIRASGHGHVGGALSAIDIVTALYFDHMRLTPQDPQWPQRDRFLLSAGHKCLAQYAVLAERGYIDKSVLDTYGALNSKIPGHPDMHKLPGVEANTGALGHGLSIAAGMAMGAKLDKTGYRVFAICGDGELAEGSNWEAVSAAAKFNLDNLVVFIDNNGLQISGPVSDVMPLGPITNKFQDFGWSVFEIDGNNMEQILDTLDSLPYGCGKPMMILSHTVKAKGLSFGENQVEYHFWNATPEQLSQADAELAAQLTVLEKELEASDGR